MTKGDKQMNDPYLTCKEVATLLKCSLKTIYNRTKKGILKRYSFGGRRIYYLRTEVELAMFSLD
jgi:excisionase family DNA binding protein